MRVGHSLREPETDNVGKNKSRETGRTRTPRTPFGPSGTLLPCPAEGESAEDPSQGGRTLRTRRSSTARSTDAEFGIATVPRESGFRRGRSSRVWGRKAERPLR
jgi:hypothetical protein